MTLSQLIGQLQQVEALYSNDPIKVLFILILMMQDNPLADDELESLFLDINARFYTHGDKAKIVQLLDTTRMLRIAAKTNTDFMQFIQNKVTTMMKSPEILDYLRRSKEHRAGKCI